VVLVHLLLPKARIVHCRRNPVDTCLSIYTTYFAQHWGFASDRGELAAYYGQYVRLTDHWRTVLPADRMIDVDYERATAAPEETARRLIAFCGLDWDAACLSPDRRAHGQSMAGAPADLPHLGRALAELRAVARRAARAAARRRINGPTPAPPRQRPAPELL